MATNCKTCDCPLTRLIGERSRAYCIRCLRVQWSLKRASKKKKGPRSRKTERTCKDCNQTFSSPDGRVLRQCEPCRKAKKAAKTKQYYEAHKEKINRQGHQRYMANSAYRRLQSRAYYEAHRDQVLARKRERDLESKVAHTKLGMMR